MADDSANPPALPSLVRFDYIKSNFHRVIHADGVVGGPTGRGKLTVTFFSERAPIPQQVAQAVIQDEATHAVTLGDEIKNARVSRDALVREVDVTVVMDLNTAVSLHAWLEGHIESLVRLDQLRQDFSRGEK